MSNSHFKIPILMYHCIESAPKSTVMRSLYVPPHRFKFQMWLLKVMGYKGLSIKDLRPYLEGEKKGKVVGITFDDGYQNNLIYAAPILTKFNFTATCYLVSDRVGDFNLWDLNKNITQKPLMTQHEVFKWINLGMDIGAHGKNHLDLTSISEKAAYEEMCESKIHLENLYNIDINDFCYPYGRFNDKVYNFAKEIGYLSSVTMLRGKASFKSDKYKLPRIPVNYRTMPYLFLAKILTKYEERK
jgi:peptidoglycan/xylan/chitin deacetylase (PgdA/CDA1 family)